MATNPCRYILKKEGVAEKDWPVFKSKEALATHLNKTPTLIKAIQGDTQNVTGVPSPVREGQTIEQTQPIEGTGAEAISPSGILEKQEIDFENAPQLTPEQETAHGAEFDAALSQVKEAAPDLSEDDSDYAAFLVQNDVPIGEAIEYTRNTPDNERSQTGNITVNGEVQPVVTEGEQQGVQPAANVKPSEGEIEVKTQANETEKTEVTATTEGGENMREANRKEPAEIFTQVDEAINKTGVEATTARRELKEKFGTDNYQKAIKITREFEKITTRLEAEGKIKIKCPS